MFIDNKLEKLRDDLYQISVSTLNGSFFHEKTNSGFIQVNRIEGNSVQNGTPTPDNPIDIKSFDGEIVTSGKNLYDLSKAYTKNGVLELIKNGFRCKGVSYIYYDIFIPSGWAFRLTWKKSNETLYNHCNVVFDNGSFGTAENGAGYGVNGRNVVGLHLAISNTTNENVDITDIILEVTKFGTEFPFDYYEPFHATKTEKLTLRSLPNGVKDTLERQNDGSYLLTQRVGYVEFDGSETLIMSDGGLSSSTNKYFVIDKTLEIANYDGKDNKNIYCNYFVGKNLWTNDEVGAEYASAVTNNTPMSVRTRTPYATVEEFTAKLKEWKANGKPLTVLYKLQNPPQPRKLWLSPLSAYEGQTNIFANSEVGAEMEVEVLTINAVNEVVQSNNEYIFQERPNPNLLVNSDFRNPINTSGKKEWTNYSEWDKVLDGWNINNVTSTVLLTKPGVKVKQSGEIHYGTFGQYFDIENSKNIMGKKITLSFYCRDLNAINFRVMFYIAPNYHVDKVWSKTIDVKLGFNEVTADIPVFDGNILAVYFYSEGESSFFELEWVKLEIGERATPMPLAKFEDEWNRLKVIKQERLLWSGSMATGQSAVVDGLSNFRNFKVYMLNVGYVYLKPTFTTISVLSGMANRFNDTQGQPTTGKTYIGYCELNTEPSNNKVLVKKAQWQFIDSTEYLSSNITEIWGIY